MFFTKDGLRFIEENGVWVFEREPLPRVIATVSHDGSPKKDFIGLFREKTKGVSVHDLNVWPIVRDILTVVPVDAVRGMIPRCFLDYNRAEREALEDRQWLDSYNTYHSSVASLARCMIEQHGAGNCLLLDFHGFSDQPSYGEYDVILGTGNRLTVFSEIDKQLADFLQFREYRVFLPREKPVGSGEDRFNGNFIIHSYAEKFGLNAIQIEIFKTFRTKEGEERGKKLASDLSNFLADNFFPAG
ncbi:MAG: hypothetical protein PHQ42_02900 [Patescibacteria group bacterium]|nr:hypothetical protein [Patescibacteria group bacterium]